ncbi:MAG: quinone-dependent dihydroorotate dehydrogenase [Patescibacteria group bacterium]
MIYEKLIRPILFKTDPEKIHNFIIGILGFVSRIKFINSIIRKFLAIKNPVLNVRLGNIALENPVGLSAGFDKYFNAPLAYPMLGFGFAELGSITNAQQPGNPKPRLWRIPEDKGLIVYYGLANSGAENALSKMQMLNSHLIPYGISIAPSNGLGTIEMVEDCARSFLKLHSVADYITLNVSCPNVAGCEMFAQVSFIKDLLVKIRNLMQEKNISKDVFIKIGPHFKEEELDQIVDCCVENKLTGIVISNLLKKRDGIVFKSASEKLNYPGGISGKILQDKSNKIIRHVYKRAGSKLKIIGVGGIFNANDAYEKIKAGASAVQMITGFIYGGPLVIRKINSELAGLLKRDGFKNVGEAVGVEV